MKKKYTYNNSQSWKSKNNKAKKQNSNKNKGSLFGRILKSKKLWISLLVLVFLGFVSVLAVFSWYSRDLPNPDQLMSRQIPQSTIIYDRTGENVLYEIHGDEKRTMVTLEEIPDHVEQATIAIEDKNFYEHSGFSLWAIGRTVITNVLYNRRAGGSTLTQQFVKNAILTPEKSYSRKIKELILSYKLEKEFSKDDILQMYLNEIPYGSNAYGVEAASKKYFGKSVSEINISEAAILAALPQAPSLYSPYNHDKETLLGRQHYIIDLMQKQGYISEEEAQKAKNYELSFQAPTSDIKAPHFVMYVKQVLAEKYGEKMIEQGGLKIYTTLDLYKQEIAEEVINEKAEANLENWDAENASLVSIDPKNGQVLAMVGSKDYFSEDIDGQFNVALSPRQPGSSLKPMVYASLFEKGYNPNTILFDVVTDFSTSGDTYTPHNYNLKELGPVSIRKSLAGSLNIPAVKALYLSGVDNVLDLLNNSGYSTLEDKERFGLSLVLGGGEVKLLEHVNAYSVFAREGEIHPISIILKVEDKDGKTLEEFKEETKNVLSSNVAKMINSVLTDNDARAYAFGTNNPLYFPGRPVAAKTGTTNNYKDAWTIGYTPSLVTGVWAGNNDNREMKRGAGGSAVAAPIWNEYMKRVLGDTPIEEFKKPEIKETGKEIIDGTIDFSKTVKIDTASGFLATEFTPESFIEEKTFANYHSILYYVDKEHPLSERPTNPESDPQFNAWENAVQEWAKNLKEEDLPEDSNLVFEAPPTKEDNLHLPENRPNLEIQNIKNNQTVRNSLLNIKINVSAPRGVGRVEYYINNNLLESRNSFPFSLSRNISFLDNDSYELRVKACDDIDNCTTETVNFNLELKDSIDNGNADISLLSPSNGLSLSAIDFPLSISLKMDNPKKISTISAYIENNEDGVKTSVLTKNSPGTETLNISWDEKPEPGSYDFWVTANTWSGEVISTDRVLLNIN
ncbi:MAG: penicillin-binding protein [Parcubacteria group bacterium]